MGLGRFLKRAVKKTVGIGLKTTGFGRLLSAGMKKRKKSMPQQPQRQRYKRRQRNMYKSSYRARPRRIGLRYGLRGQAPTRGIARRSVGVAKKKMLSSGIKKPVAAGRRVKRSNLGALRRAAIRLGGKF